MPKISWNDINDEDSSLASDQGQSLTNKIQEKSLINSANKSKLNAACDQKSLIKIENHIKANVWLYILNSFREKADQIDRFLEENLYFKKIIRIKSIGWNVETTLERAKELILEGIKFNGMQIKFIYSNRNEDNIFEEKESINKLQKKVTYVQKNNKPILIEKSHSLTEETQKKLFNSEEQENNLKKTKEDKQKPKWVQKTKNMTIQIKNQSKSTIQVENIQSPRQFNRLKQCKSPKRYVEKNTSNLTTHSAKKQIPQVCQSKQKIIQQKPSLTNKEALPICQKQQQIKKQVNLQSSDSSSVKITGLIEQREVLISQNEDKQVKQLQEQDSEQEKQEKKKKKRNKRKNKDAKVQKKDNNPFSYLMRP